MIQNSRLVICDPQTDLYDGKMLIIGANDALTNIANLIDRVGSIGMNPLTGISLIRNNRRVVHISHPNFWLGVDGKNPQPFTTITTSEVMEGKWTPRGGGLTPPVLGGKSIKDHVLEYLQKIDKKSVYPFMVFPEYCITGTPGHTIHPDLMSALMHWERQEFAEIDIVEKTSNHFVEQIGGLVPEKSLKADKSTGLDVKFLNDIKDADAVAFAGLPLSHTLWYTIDQAMKYLPTENYSKWYILNDCTLSMPRAGGVDFPALTEEWLTEIQKKGVHVIASKDFLTK